MIHAQLIKSSLLGSTLAIGLCACAADVAVDDGGGDVAVASAELGLRPTELTPFAFTSHVSTSGQFPDGDVRLDSVEVEGKKISSKRLVTVAHAKILIDDGVDVVRGGNNYASGQGINSELDDYAP